MTKPLVLMILDGFGYREDPQGNAIAAANTPNLDRIFAQNPTTLLGCSGPDVGLPQGQMGNSEVGHTNMGAGRIVYQELTRITRAIQSGEFYQNPVLCQVVDHCLAHHTALHLMGLLSDGGVHSHLDHLAGLLHLARQRGLQKVYLHCFLDGRDVSPTSGSGYLAQAQDLLNKEGVGQIATVCGRYYAMDRDRRWDRVQRAYNALVLGEGESCEDPAARVQALYEAGTTDEFIPPLCCCEGGRVQPQDGVVFFNFRPDRARELTRALVDPDFDGFDRPLGCFPLKYVCMTQYDAAMPNVQVAFPPQQLHNTLGEYLSKAGKRQLRIAETEKYAHVTFFFNGGVEDLSPGEDRVLILSPKVATYDQKPEMSAYEVAAEAVKRVESGAYDVIILNFANCDMVGHTGDFPATVKAVEAVDACAGQVIDAVLKAGGGVFLTADHGNADQMLDEDGEPFTAHTTNPVIFASIGIPGALRTGGRLADIAPTMLQVLGLPQPAEMEGASLFVAES